MTDIVLKIISFISILIIIKFFLLLILDIFKVQYPFKNLVLQYRLHFLFIISTVGVLGSLFLSAILGLQVCNLCWYQRIFLFPIPILALIGIYKQDAHTRLYIFALSLVGFGFAWYHSLLQSSIFKRDAVFCNPNSTLIDCSIPSFTYFGFVTVPVISAAIFILISYVAYTKSKK